VFRLASLSALLCVVATPTLAQPNANAPSLPTRSGVFHMRLDADRTVYAVREPIQLRVTITNASGQYYAVTWAPPWQQCRLLVADGAGEVLVSTGRRGGNTASARNIVEFPPGKTLVADFPDPKAAFRSLEWADLSYWGYSLTKPGDYTITAVPELTAFGRTNNMKGAGPRFMAAPTDRSNVVRIRVVK